jgi:prophage maintenance system killer protein/phage regulator Rha-like protein
MKEETKGEIVIYKAASGPELKVSIKDNSIWLSQAQIAELFGTQRPAITKHLNNIYKTAELSEKAVCSIMEHTASDGKTYKVKYFNLDAVIAVGYRVNSKRATQFRIWATNRLRDYVLNGLLIDQQRIKENNQAKLKELQQALHLIQGAIETKRLAGYEKELLQIITDYANTWILLNQYDNHKLDIVNVSAKAAYRLDYEKIKKSIEQFKARLVRAKQASDIFGTEVEFKLKALLGNVEQTFGGKNLYASIEEKAAHLLYFAIKDHPFTDGNKRIGSLLFLLYLVENNYLYNKKGERKINDAALTALALLVAESKPEQKDVMVKLVVNLINRK